jgi:hypothetical protein
MKFTRQSALTTSALIIGGFLGASALVAFADSTWTSAPNCSGTTMPCSNVAAPINVGPSTQVKTGELGLGSLQFDPSGETVTPGQVLVATDAYGTVAWGTSGSSSGSTTATAIQSTGSVMWSELINSNGIAVSCTGATGAGVCKKNVVLGVTLGASISCGSAASMLDTVTSVSEATAGSATIYHIGYCVPIR